MQFPNRSPETQKLVRYSHRYKSTDHGRHAKETGTSSIGDVQMIAASK